MVDTTLYADLPFRHLKNGPRASDEDLKIKKQKQKKNQGERIQVISSSNFVAPMPENDVNKVPDYDLDLENEKKKKNSGEVVEIDSTMLYSMPMFQKGAKLSALEKDVKK